MEIYFCAHGNFPPFARRHFFPAEGVIFRSEGGEFSKVGKFVFQAWKIFFPRQENFLSSEGKWIALGKQKDRPSEEKRLPSEGRKERAGSAVAKPALLRLRRGKGKAIARLKGRE